jgi:S1-C subfamily serine protease
MKAQLTLGLLSGPCVDRGGLAATAAEPSITAKEPASAKKPVLRPRRLPTRKRRQVAGLVASYADIVEPVQKAVVSVYSTKIVRERSG